MKFKQKSLTGDEIAAIIANPVVKGSDVEVNRRGNEIEIKMPAGIETALAAQQKADIKALVEKVYGAMDVI
jgi:hypothetical protein